MKHVSVIVALVALLSLTSCATRMQSGALGGAAVGAAIGQAVGHNAGATIFGAALGSMLGAIIGNEMDKNDRQRLTASYENGQRSAWVNSTNGNRYTVTPEQTYRDSSTNQVCRQAQIDAVIDGKPQRTYSTACRDSQGYWRLQN